MKVSITKVRDEWVNNPPKGFKVEFKKYPTGRVNSFLYQWIFEIKDKELLKEAGFDTMFYGGYHLDGTDLYTFSCELELINKLVIAQPSEVKKTLIIHDWGNEDEMKRAEFEYLDANDSVKKKDWFNQQNNFGKKFTQKPRYDMIRNLSRDWYILKNNQRHRENELTYHTFDDIKDPRPVMDFHPDNMKNLQPRNVSEYQDLIQSIQFMIDKGIQDGTDITKKAKPPVVITDRTFLGKFYSELLGCGKHTSKSYYTHDNGKYAKLPWIEVRPEIAEQFTDIELLKAVNEDNQPENSSKPIVKEDIIKELKIQVEKYGLDWDTPEEKSRAEELLRTDSWSSISKSMKTWEKDQDRIKQGLAPRINWKSKERLKEVQEMARKGHKENPDTWYCPQPYSSQSLRYDSNVIKPYDQWIEDNDIKNPPKKVKTFVHFSSEGDKKDFYKDGGNRDLVYKRCTKYLDESKLTIDFIPLAEFEEDIVI